MFEILPKVEQIWNKCSSEYYKIFKIFLFYLL